MGINPARIKIGLMMMMMMMMIYEVTIKIVRTLKAYKLVKIEKNINTVKTK